MTIIQSDTRLSTRQNTKIYRHSNERKNMKNLLFILVLVAVILSSGCVGGNKETLSTPTPQIIYETVTVTPKPIMTVAPPPSITTYCNDTRNILEIIGAIPGSRYSRFHWTDKTPQKDKDEVYNQYKKLIIDFEDLRVGENDFNNDFLNDSPELSKSQSCNWIVYCLNGLPETKCYEIPLKYRVTYYEGNTLMYQDFPITRPFENDFNDNGLTKMIKI